MDKVRFETSGALGLLTLANPPLNLFCGVLIEDLRATVTEVKRTPLRALAGACRGQDLFRAEPTSSVLKGKTATETRELFTCDSGRFPTGRRSQYLAAYHNIAMYEPLYPANLNVTSVQLAAERPSSD